MTHSLQRDAQGCLITPSVTAEQLKDFRKELAMTQEQFSKEFDIPLGTLRDWEQGIRSKSRASRIFLGLLQKTVRPNLKGESKNTELTAG